MRIFHTQTAALYKIQSLGSLVSDSAFAPLLGEPKLPVAVSRQEMGVTFIGHSSFLVQIAGRNLLLDPVFAMRLIALRRLRRAGVRMDDLPAIDAVLISHAHMDHLNRPSLRRIAAHTRRLTGKAPVVVAPWGVDDLLSDLGFSKVITLEWWQEKHIAGLKITMTPSKHWGARFFKDAHRGFGGFVIRAGTHSIYHSGDTAYFDGFARIGKQLKPRIALLPIGAYQPEAYRAVHTSPEDALKAFLDLGADRMVPMHYGTFRLSQEPDGEPVRRLLAAADEAGVSRRISVLEEGSTLRVTPASGQPEHGKPAKAETKLNREARGALLDPSLSQVWNPSSY